MNPLWVRLISSPYFCVMVSAPPQQSTRTRVINVFRNFLKFRPAELFLASLTQGRSRTNLAWKLIPPEYLYQTSRYHRLTRGEIVLDLDLSNHNDYYVFYGFTEPPLLYLFSLIQPDFTVIDIGANIGFTALNFARRCKYGFVYAYEPHDVSYSKLCRNASLNHFSNLTVFQKGLGEKEATQQLVTLNKHHSGMNRIQSAVSGGVESESVKVVRLDTEVIALNIKKVSLIKIDVEGYELNVIRGALNTIRKFKPILFVELNEENLKQYGHSSETLVNLLWELGYRVLDSKTGDVLRNSNWDSMETDILCLPIGGERSGGNSN